MCLEIAEAETQAKILHEQLRFIRQQENDNIPAKHLQVRCVCLKLVRWTYMHRCLYCSVFYCKECAEKHFGLTIDEYKASQE